MLLVSFWLRQYFLQTTKLRLLYIQQQEAISLRQMN